MRPMAGLKGHSMSVSFLKIDRILGRLEYEEGTRMLCLGIDCFGCA